MSANSRAWTSPAPSPPAACRSLGLEEARRWLRGPRRRGPRLPWHACILSTGSAAHFLLDAGPGTEDRQQCPARSGQPGRGSIRQPVGVVFGRERSVRLQPEAETVARHHGSRPSRPAPIPMRRSLCPWSGGSMASSRISTIRPPTSFRRWRSSSNAMFPRRRRASTPRRMAVWCCRLIASSIRARPTTAVSGSHIRWTPMALRLQSLVRTSTSAAARRGVPTVLRSGPNGTLKDLSVFVERGGESVATDAAGRVYVANGQVFVYGPNKEQLKVIEVPERPLQLLVSGSDPLYSEPPFGVLSRDWRLSHTFSHFWRMSDDGRVVCPSASCSEVSSSWPFCRIRRGQRLPSSRPIAARTAHLLCWRRYRVRIERTGVLRSSLSGPQLRGNGDRVYSRAIRQAGFLGWPIVGSFTSGGGMLESSGRSSAWPAHGCW